MKMFGLLFCLSVLPIANAPRRIPPRAQGPSLEFGITLSGQERRPLEKFQVAVIAPGGQISWTYQTETRKDTNALIQRGAILAQDWYTGPGNYSLRVSYSPTRPSGPPPVEQQGFALDGQELRITSNLWFIDDEKAGRVFLADLTTRRYLPGSGKVSLVQDWAPDPEARPQYRILNTSVGPIYGVGLYGNFFGTVQRNINGIWVAYPRGGFCGTVGMGQPLQPNEEVGSHEGYFIGQARPFVTGVYRYVAGYSLAPVSEGVPSELADKGLTLKRSQDIYEIAAEFYIGPK